MSEQTIALVTGANKGIGYEIAAGLGMTVGVGARDARRGEEAAAKLRANSVDAFAVPLDVTDDGSIKAAAALFEERFGRLDVLVNNAAIAGSWPAAPSAATPESLREVLETNVTGVVRVTNAMLPLLARSARPRIVNQSSHLASLTLQTTPGVEFGEVNGAYTPSKTFLNALTVQYAKELPHMRINGACPPCPTTVRPAACSTTPEPCPGEGRAIVQRETSTHSVSGLIDTTSCARTD
ncbi:NADP-dependent 3-hydroxy acid dehydrogenase YdfG [Lentzea atacamensis]|uniref:NADP-dependent 3-hydroxy acid dehydrogenase YdfG n=1 Tax=Lentzea atacamensis TaxID=531938 RepID=A0ABX9EEG3_9PSEU|nr:NADP-dependent 3-hydroxy acid dehydrogenase YdfG [Lentzea atacamensis]